MSKKKGGKRCRDWNGLSGDHGLNGAFRFTKHGINVRFDGPFLSAWTDGSKLSFEFSKPTKGANWDNPPSTWGKSV